MSSNGVLGAEGWPRSIHWKAELLGAEKGRSHPRGAVSVSRGLEAFPQKHSVVPHHLLFICHWTPTLCMPSIILGLQRPQGTEQSCRSCHGAHGPGRVSGIYPCKVVAGWVPAKSSMGGQQASEGSSRKWHRAHFWRARRSASGKGRGRGIWGKDGSLLFGLAYNMSTAYTKSFTWILRYNRLNPVLGMPHCTGEWKLRYRNWIMYPWAHT